MAKGDLRKAAERWLKEQGIIENLEDQQYEQVKKLIGDPSFGIFWAMLRWQREMAAIALSNASLGSPEKDSTASVLQGHIRAIDGIHTTLLNIAEPEVEADAASAKKEQQ